MFKVSINCWPFTSRHDSINDFRHLSFDSLRLENRLSNSRNFSSLTMHMAQVRRQWTDVYLLMTRQINEGKIKGWEPSYSKYLSGNQNYTVFKLSLNSIAYDIQNRQFTRFSYVTWLLNISFRNSIKAQVHEKFIKPICFVSKRVEHPSSRF